MGVVTALEKKKRALAKLIKTRVVTSKMCN